MNVPFYNIDRYYRNNKAVINELVEKTFDSGKVLEGSEVKEFEKNIATYCQRKYAVSVGSCTDALFFALSACGISTGDEVIITGFSFIASVTPVLRAGAVPVFLDINSETYTMDLSQVEAMISPKTKAIIAVHLFGQMLPINELSDIAKKHNLILIEDAAQAMGSEYNGIKAGKTGNCSCISFDPSKIISAFGSGGVLLTDDEVLYKKTLSLRYHGKNYDSGDFETCGYNSRMSTIQAGILNHQLKNINFLIESRNNVASLYCEKLNDIKEIQLPAINKNALHIFHKFVIKAKNRNELKTFLAENSIQSMIHYERPLFDYGLFKNYQFKKAEIKNIYSVGKEVLSLPIYPELTNDEINYICEKIKEFY